MCVCWEGSTLTSNWTWQVGHDVECESLTSGRSQNHVFQSALEPIKSHSCIKSNTSIQLLRILIV